ncbi:MAG: bifunctional phosphoribosylaminoimidazolecarboxamide formyltransferase/IMP cyclohydrolase [Gammaproteobacteria bacterium]
MWPIQYALISVSDKTGIGEFTKQLHELGINILASGGTAQHLRELHIPVTEISDYTGFPEILDGRVKTLHPKIHAGILARLDRDEATLQDHQILPIGLVVVNLYPFTQIVSDPECPLATAIANIDIGGPTLLRAAAKNYKYVTPLVNHADYQSVLEELRTHGGSTTLATRFYLAQKVFAHTAQYEAAIANYLTRWQTLQKRNTFPGYYTTQWQKKQDLRYGENPHQTAAFYQDLHPVAASITTATQLQGKELSFNNIADADTALECVKNFAEPACVIVKHANPCGVALGKDLTTAYQRAFSADSISAFGGILAFNQPLTATLAKAIVAQFVEVIIAPSFALDAQVIFAEKPNIRLLQCGEWVSEMLPAELEYHKVTGGMLLQQRDQALLSADQLRVVSQRQPTETEWLDLLFAWRVVRFVKSNAIVFAKEKMTVGIGAGQTSRLDSVKIAINKAHERKLSISGAVLASDAFFPFRDGIDLAHTAGITAVIQPGGSLRDREVIQAADEAGLAMVFTGLRHFRH